MKDLQFVIRLLIRNPLIFVTNVTGLGVALTTVILALTYLRFELSYDNHFQTKDRVVRLYTRVTDNTTTKVFGISLREAYTRIPERVPEIEAAVQLYGGWPTSVTNNENQLKNIRVFYADKEFFQVFSLTLQYGDGKTALSDKNTAVITTSLAKKLFKTESCLGKSIEADGEKIVVSGVMDEIPKNSHLNFDLLISTSTLDMRWLSSSLEFQTYYLLKPNIDQEATKAKIAAANNLIMADWATAYNGKVQSGVEPLIDLYLYSAASEFIPNRGSLKQMMIIGLIALFVLLTALFSYINLFIIQGEKRIVEISTRTMFGATKTGIAKLFFLETTVVFLISTFVAALITCFSIPYISDLLQSKVGLSDLLSRWGITSIIILLVLLLVITSGYPVIYLSRMKYALGLRGKISARGNNSWLSSVSVFVQFTVTAFFISCVVIMLSQLGYMHRVPLGFEKHNVTTVSNCSNAISKKYNSLKVELLKLPFITAVSGGEHFMGGGCSGQYIRNTWDDESNNKGINEYREKPGFGELLKLQLVDGRFFRESMADSHAVVLNESAIRLLGLKPKAGQTILYKDERTEIIGIVRDFYYMSNPGEPIEPLVIANCFGGTPNIYLRSSTPLSGPQLMQVKAVFSRFDANFIFTHNKLADIFDRMYNKENRLAWMVFIGAVQVAVISLISLLALTILKISRRTKEIGIRRVNGSSVSKVIFVLFRETMIVVILAIFAASILSYIVMNQWLTGFVQRIHLHPGYFLTSALFVCSIAVLAIVWQAWQAATGNPAEALRYE